MSRTLARQKLEAARGALQCAAVNLMDAAELLASDPSPAAQLDGVTLGLTAEEFSKMGAELATIGATLAGRAVPPPVCMECE